MAKVFRLTLGSIDKFAVAEDYEEMYEKRAEVDPTFAYTPVEIQLLHVDGYEIEAHKVPIEEPKQQGLLEVQEAPEQSESWIEGATKAELTAHLEEKGVEVKSKATLKELKELAYQTV
ncbi:hypothetical protein D0U04_07830 [Bacillus clarus]|uniref:Uncharacterized protein n=1 Tax=Bacillus clarus TaxID=2338372 RepID=A0A090Z0M8_9BACI|nr:hypothetical protein [Bacillus clarus]KFN03720.1 hypothetical protein DJ93_4903 [Bacillus clarus]RFT67663.1 hypothetical protein D0U04_07830 [Bacillus clarus]